MSQSTPQVQRRYRDKMIENGYARLTVWVPASGLAEVKDIIEEIKEEHEAQRLANEKLAAKKKN